MRDIKFRAWNGDGWVFGSYATDNKDYHAILSPINIDEMSNIPVDRESVGQFTGLKDKNGADIYEGDIVSPEKSGWCTKGLGVIEFIGGGFVNEKDGAHYAFHDINSEHHEVIGNIYENPEFITK